MSRWTRWWPWAFLMGWLCSFAGAGLGARFTGDDLMNLHFHLTPSLSQLVLKNITFWSTEYRPMGGIFYASIYHLFGFHPLPFRVGCFALIVVNLVLLYRVCARLSGSREAGLLAALLDGYHAWFVDLYYSTGTVYELLCFAFYVGAFDLYTGIREKGRTPTGRDWALLLALYIAALDSKELAVTLPLALGCYELLWHRQRKGWMGVCLTGLATIPYVIGKLTGAGSLMENPAYRPVISLGRYFGTFRLYLNVIFYSNHFFRPFPSALLIVLMLGAALWLRSRPLLFAWLFILFSPLPFIFVPHYSGFFIYLPMLGWTLYVATALVTARRNLMPRMPEWALFLAVALVLAPLHVRESRKTKPLFESASLPTTEAIAGLERAKLALPVGAHVFFDSDPFPAGGYSLLFLMQEFYRDNTLQIGRAKDGARPDGERWNAVLEWRNRNWVVGGL
ncbi:MAG TPA: glycosyltransferase family 39 protein [Bryobacteraceae bacterium]